MGHPKLSHSLPSLIIVIISLIGLVAVLSNFNRLQTWFSQASGEPANIKVDTLGFMGVLPRPWQMLAEGGESPEYRFFPVTGKLRALKPQYVRLDHIYDFYDVVAHNPNGSLKFSWTKLDLIINDITSAGAIPFISLSYMPPVISSGGLTDPPLNWADWSTVIQNTIEHFSGRSNLNLANVYYEVWNEPDLFGQWKTYGPKNYFTLYESAAKGALAAKDVNAFKFGGPATTKLYDNWVTRFVDFTVKNNLRFDFFSWHRYSLEPDDFLQDYDRYDQLMRAYPNLILQVEPLISEWGPTSEVNPDYDSMASAAHTTAVLSTLIPKINKLFLFEFQDGKDPGGQEYWGKWGLLTHQDFGSHEKPRYQALLLLNRLGDKRLSLVGNGDWVKGLAAQKADGTTQVLITNYDPLNAHVETVPLTFLRLQPGTYVLTQEFMNRPVQSFTYVTQTSNLSHSITLPPNDIVYLELKLL